MVALLLCTAAYLNWSYVEPPADLLQTDGSSADSASAASDDGAAAGEDYFASSRLTREKARDEAVSTLKELSESADADETAKEDAASQISALAAAGEDSRTSPARVLIGVREFFCSRRSSFRFGKSSETG